MALKTTDKRSPRPVELEASGMSLEYTDSSSDASSSRRCSTMDVLPPAQISNRTPTREYEDMIEELNTRNEFDKAEIQQLRTKLTDTHNTIETLEDTVRTLQASLSSAINTAKIQEKQGGLKIKVETLKDNVADLQSQLQECIESRDGAIRQLEEEKSAFEADDEFLRCEIDRLTDQLAGRDKNIYELTVNLNGTEAKLDCALAELNEMDLEARELAQEIHYVREDLKSLQGINATLEEQNDELKLDNRRLQKIVRQREAQVAEEINIWKSKMAASAESFNRKLKEREEAVKIQTETLLESRYNEKLAAALKEKDERHSSRSRSEVSRTTKLRAIIAEEVAKKFRDENRHC